jgi:type II secretion system protein G
MAKDRERKEVNTMRKAQEGFTLIELLIVIAIILILIGIALPNFLEAQLRAKTAKVQGDLRGLATAVEMYSLDWRKYPCDQQEDPKAFPRCGIGDWWAAGNKITTPVAYIKRIPVDPFVLALKAGGGQSIVNSWYVSREGYGCDETFMSKPSYCRSRGRPVTVGGRTNVRLFDPPRSRYQYGFISPGPDGYWEWDRVQNAPGMSKTFFGDVMYYTPTNGSNSQGDLYCYGPGAAFNPLSSFR